MESAIKAAVGEPPVQTEGAKQNSDDLSPGLVQLRECHGQDHQCTAKQPRAISAVVGKKRKQATHQSTLTLSQSGKTKKPIGLPMGFTKQLMLTNGISRVRSGSGCPGQ